MCAMGAFKAAVQALVAHATVAVAVTGLLIDNVLDLRGQFVRVRLKWVPVVFAPQLIFTENRRQLSAFRGWTGMKSREAILLRVANPRRRNGQRKYRYNPEQQCTLHHAQPQGVL